SRRTHSPGYGNPVFSQSGPLNRSEFHIRGRPHTSYGAVERGDEQREAVTVGLDPNRTRPGPTHRQSRGDSACRAGIGIDTVDGAEEMGGDIDIAVPARREIVEPREQPRHSGDDGP